MIFFWACCWCASFKFVNRLSIGRILIRVICWSVCGGWGHTERSSLEAYGMPGCGSCWTKTKRMGNPSEGVRLWALRPIDVLMWGCPCVYLRVHWCDARMNVWMRIDRSQVPLITGPSRFCISICHRHNRHRRIHSSNLNRQLALTLVKKVSPLAECWKKNKA